MLRSIDIIGDPESGNNGIIENKMKTCQMFYEVSLRREKEMEIDLR